jgi:hypothetical protein
MCLPWKLLGVSAFFITAYDMFIPTINLAIFQVQF